MSMPAEPQQMGGVQNRNEAFGQGMTGGPQLPAQIPPSFVQQAQKLNPGAPAKVKMLGTANGMAASQATNTMNGMLSDTGNGMATGTYDTKKWMEPR